MKKLTSVLAIWLLASSVVCTAQNNQAFSTLPAKPPLIAVVNRANYCIVCKANEQRIRQLLLPYTAKGLTIYYNDLTNDSSKAASKLALQKATIYEAVISKPPKGMRHLLTACGLASDKKVTEAASGIVTFIHPTTHQQLKQLSLASTNEAMTSTIEKLLNLSL
jgi:hypothetical protein